MPLSRRSFAAGAAISAALMPRLAKATGEPKIVRLQTRQIDLDGKAEVRLHLINGAASTNFTIDLGAIEGTLVAVDGNPILLLKARQFPLGVAQRLHGHSFQVTEIDGQ